jgi:hypothetical protein
MGISIPHRISASQALSNAGMEDLADLFDDSTQVPACCSEGCLVEGDGECEHGYPSVLLEMGMI